VDLLDGQKGVDVQILKDDAGKYVYEDKEKSTPQDAGKKGSEPDSKENAIPATDLEDGLGAECIQIKMEEHC